MWEFVILYRSDLEIVLIPEKMLPAISSNFLLDDPPLLIEGCKLNLVFSGDIMRLGSIESSGLSSLIPLE